MKTFVYCEITDGGMEHHVCSFKEGVNIDFPIYGWKSKSVKKTDRELVKWCHQAKIGDYTNHRLGIVFRVNNEK